MKSRCHNAAGSDGSALTGPRDEAHAVRGFTLIELLVVVAIIALLISILLPALSRAREQGRQLQCVTNLRSMGQAAMLYADEYGGTLVRNVPDGARIQFAISMLKGLNYDGSIFQLWRINQRMQDEWVTPVFKQTPQFQCPKFPEPNQFLDYIVNGMPFPYTRNNIDRDTGNGDPPGESSETQNQGSADDEEFFRIEKLTGHDSSRFIYVGEAHSTLPTNHYDLHDSFFASQLPFGAYPRFANDLRHPAGTNALFFDGHAETMTFRQIDAGWPKPLRDRLWHFTVVPPDLEP